MPFKDESLCTYKRSPRALGEVDPIRLHSPRHSFDFIWAPLLTSSGAVHFTSPPISPRSKSCHSLSRP